MGINNPIPRSLSSECRKAAKILASFIKPNQLLSASQVIPPDVLQNAKGLVVLTVLKAGFLFSGRAGSGVIVARLPDGSWSAPSAVVTAGAGVGGQIGAELTDFVFILNTEAAVRSFAQAGSITLGGNVSLAAGPLGRNAEAAGTASLKSVAAVFSYSKTKGLFAGVSLEGSVLIERREANRKFYGDNCTAKTILSGRVDPPPSVDPLFRVLESRAFNRRAINGFDNDFYDDIPDEFSDTSSSPSRSNRDISSRFRTGSNNSNSRNHRFDDSYDDGDDFYNNNRKLNQDRKQQRNYKSSTNSSWGDDIYDRSPPRNSYTESNGDNLNSKPIRPNSSKPSFNSSDYKQQIPPSSNTPAATPPAYSSAKGIEKAIALYSFKGEQPGDVPFKKGDVITITEKTDSVDDWWTGSVNGQSGIFPANYVELV